MKRFKPEDGFAYDLRGPCSSGEELNCNATGMIKNYRGKNLR